MEPVNPTCEETQESISAALDDDRSLPAEALEHADTCAECGRFLAAWTGEAADLLAARRPGADPGLREAVLRLAEAEAVRAEPAQRWKKARHLLSAAAAVLVLGLCARWLIDVQPADSGRSGQDEQQEMAALRDDMRHAVATLRQPAEALQRILSP